jgi:hypothetical protein
LTHGLNSADLTEPGDIPGDPELSERDSTPPRFKAHCSGKTWSRRAGVDREAGAESSFGFEKRESN